MPPEFTDNETPEPGRRLAAAAPPQRRGPRQPLLLDDPPAEPPGVHRLHTAAMMADVLGVPPAAIRHWSRGGLLVPAHIAGSVEWFDFPQLVVGRHLARLLAGGGSRSAKSTPNSAASRRAERGLPRRPRRGCVSTAGG